MTPLDFGLSKAAYTISETLTIVPAGRTALYSDIKQGKLKIVKRGRSTWVLTPDLIAYLMTLRGGE